ncbi:MAG TPA: hypothetical protein VK550_03655 [Polyangiaceae bacterium]|jgi:hypothetical protein|nr:hypothetical protein [Polyangiaceae bacterium]
MNDRLHRLLRGTFATTFVAASIVWCNCSLIASQRSIDQCHSDRDCSSLSGMTCDPAQHVCVSAPTAPPDAAAGDVREGGMCWGARDDASCFACPAQTESELLNACSSTSCVPFYNSERIAGFEIGQPLRPPVPVPNPTSDAAPPSDAGSAPDAGDAGRPSTNARCSDLVPAPLYLMASSAFTLILRTFAQALASEVTLVYKYDTSCPSLDSILTGDTKIKGTAVYWSGDRQLECDVEQPIFAQIGGVDVSPEACVPGYTGSPNLVDEPGPIQVFMFTVPRASSQTSISAQAAYNVWGFGEESGVEPWIAPQLIFKRFFDSGVQQVIAATIRLPMNAWRGTAIKGSGEMKPALIASSDPERTIGITSADQADAQDARANLRTLAYQHYEQNCGYLPDSGPGSFDKKNVRDGHYTLWAPYHFYSRKSDRMHDDRIANVINYLTGAKRLPNPNTDLITTLKQGGLVPSCAMRVEREKEGAIIRPYEPSPSCGCYYDVTSPGGYTPPECASCRTDRDCPVERPICSFGYCEPD